MSFFGSYENEEKFRKIRERYYEKYYQIDDDELMLKLVNTDVKLREKHIESLYKWRHDILKRIKEIRKRQKEGDDDAEKNSD